MKWLHYRNWLFFFSGILSLQLNAQQGIATMDLKDAINTARQYSLDYQAARQAYEYSYVDYKSFISSRYPNLSMSGTFPNYTRAIGLITLPNGEPYFVGQDQAVSNLSLNLSQPVLPTGGTFTLSSSLNRADVFGKNRSTTYSSVPVTISYMQNMVGYNAYKWQQKTALARVETAEKSLLEQGEDISLKTVGYYFEMLQIQSALRLAIQNYANADTLYKISQQRFTLGTVSKSELLQLQLNLLNVKNELLQDSINYTMTTKRFLEYFVLPPGTPVQLRMPDDVHFFQIDVQTALQQSHNNNRSVFDARQMELEAAQQLAQARAQNSVYFNINANLGFTRTANAFKSLYNDLEQQRNLGVSFNIPIINWGYNRLQKQKFITNLAMVKTRNQQTQIAMEQEVFNSVSRWNFQQQLLSAAIVAREIAVQRYELEKTRYLSGNISLNDFNIAQQQKDEASSRYIQVLKIYWELYYSLRKLTLYDFAANNQLKLNIRD